MSQFLLLRFESPQEALQRLLRGRIEAAAGEVARGHLGAHDARKRLREARSCLALAHSGVRGPHKRIAGLLREAAHHLAPIRDADALGEVLSALLRDPPGKLDKADVAAARGVVAEHRARMRRTASEALSATAGALSAAESALDELRFAGGWKRIVDGHARSLRRARSAWRDAKRGRSDEDLHDWRKRLKEIRHQAELLSPIFPPVLDGWAEACHEAADLLGERRDLAMLRQIARRAAGTTDLLAVLAHRCDKLAERALAAGERLHAVSPDDQTSAVKSWLRAWRRDG